MQPAELHKVVPSTLLHSQEPQRGFRDLWLQWGCAFGRTSQWPQH